MAVAALAGGAPLRRDDLMAAWSTAGLTTSGQRGYHMLWHLAQTGTVCFGPVRDGEQRIVLVGEWVRRPRRLEREAALGEGAWRYFRSHGPATVKDYSRWTGLVAADVRAGLAWARPRLAAVTARRRGALMDPETPELLAAWRRDAGGVLLLPGFDELVLGYGDRRAVLPVEFAERFVPGRNGVFKPTVVSNGQVVGTWKHRGRGARRTISATPFTAFTDEVAAAIPRLYAALP